MYLQNVFIFISHTGTFPESISETVLFASDKAWPWNWLRSILLKTCEAAKGLFGMSISGNSLSNGIESSMMAAENKPGWIKQSVSLSFIVSAEVNVLLVCRRHWRPLFHPCYVPGLCNLKNAQWKWRNWLCHWPSMIPSVQQNADYCRDFADRDSAPQHHDSVTFTNINRRNLRRK